MQLKGATTLEQQIHEAMTILEKQPPSEAQTKLVSLFGESGNELQRLRGQRDLLLKTVRDSIEMLSQSVGFSAVLGRELLRILSIAHQEIKI